jgi:hypothetical protein
MTTKETKVKKTKKTKAKRNGSRAKRPVLTSPWKIGMFVSLLLVFMSLGVGYYIVSFYDVDIKWIESGAGGWSLDSMLFVNDMAPLAAAVVIVSLIGYFLIASAVHRYKFYLDSGQDYRSMISLAESIDDLTNPAQIARLSPYPELQAVLRSYGDQIREISQDLGTKDTASSYEELKSGVENLLGGDPAAGDPCGETDAGSICAKLRDRVEADRVRIAELEQRNAHERRAYGQAALAYGRAMEAISGAGEELLAITNAVAELTSVAERIGANATTRAAAASKAGAGARNGTLKTTVSEMEGAVRKLEEGSRALQEFSEENNGIAIQLALMAARGNVDEHALATFAERVRSTAERFHKLSGGVSSIAQGLLGNCYAIKETSGMPVEEGAPPIGAEVSRAIVEIARRVEERSSALETRIMGLGSELHDVHELLQGDARNGAGPAAGSEPAPEPRAASAAVAADHPGDEDRFVIDHGSTWAGVGARNGPPEATESGRDEEQGFSFKNLDEMKAAFAQTAVPKQAVEPKRAAEPPRENEKKTSNFSDMTSLRDLDGASEHTWRTVEVEKTETDDEAGQVDVTVQAAPPEAPHEEPEIAFESASEAPPAAEKRDEDSIHDLFDLGAVEYVEENQVQR